MNFEIKINKNSEGFITQECPSCRRRFKTQPGMGSDAAISFCPYCDHTGTKCWWTKEQADYISEASSYHANQLIHSELGKMTRSLGSNKNSFLSIELKAPRKFPLPQPPAEPDESWPQTFFDCCNEVIQHDGHNEESLFCVICGSETRLEHDRNSTSSRTQDKP